MVKKAGEGQEEEEKKPLAVSKRRKVTTIHPYHDLSRA